MLCGRNTEAFPVAGLVRWECVKLIFRINYTSNMYRSLLLPKWYKLYTVMGLLHD